MSSTTATTTQEEISAAEAEIIRELKRKRQKQLMQKGEVSIILNDLHKELQQLNLKKKDCILNAAERMANVIPKEMVAKELVQGLRLLNFRVDRAYIYKVLSEKWPFEYRSGSPNSLLHLQQIDEDKDIEDSRERLLESGAVTKEEIERSGKDGLLP